MTVSSATLIVCWCVILAEVQREGWAQMDQIQSSSAPSKANAPDSTGRSSKSSNPYAIIVNRNIFGLSDPPPPSPPPPPPRTVSLPNIKFTGFIKLPGEPTRAIFVSIPQDPRCAATNFIVAEGEHNQYLELVNVFADRKSARVIIAGNALTLALQDCNPTVPAPYARPVPGPWLTEPQPNRFPP